MINQNLLPLWLIQVCPSDLNYVWQVELQLHTLREQGLSDRSRNLIFIPYDRIHLPVPNEWKKLEEKYPEAHFYYYLDSSGECLNKIRSVDYIPYLRPWCLKKHFESFPELEQAAIWYWDADCIFTSSIEWNKYIQKDDQVCYLSYTGKRYPGGNYINGEYLIKKENDALPHGRERLKELDVVEKLAKEFNITKQIILDNNNNTGGAQYLLKGINAAFWEKVMVGITKIRPFLQWVNREFFSSENAGYQSWCADMWSVLWTLWGEDKQTSCPEELDFNWATDPIGSIKEKKILHNAGVTGITMSMNGQNHTFFHKNKINYVNNLSSPYKEREYLQSISKDYCTGYYSEKLLSVADPVF